MAVAGVSDMFLGNLLPCCFELARDIPLHRSELLVVQVETAQVTDDRPALGAVRATRWEIILTRS